MSTNGKGSLRRPCLIGHEEENLRWALAFGEITLEQFQHGYDKLLEMDKIVRDGRPVGKEHK